MRDLGAELKSLRLYGMASAWADLVAQGGGASLDASRWLVEHLLQAAMTGGCVPSPTRCGLPASRYTGTWPGSTSSPHRWTGG